MENHVVSLRHKANIPVRMASDGTSHTPSNWAIEPRMQEPGVIAARTLLSDGHEEVVARVCNYCSQPYTFKVDSFLGVAEPVSHVTAANGRAV